MGWKMQNKKGNILSVWWFAVLTLIGASVVLGVVLFYSSYLDVKDTEAGILSSKIERCFIENKIDITDIKFLDEFDIFSECGLSKEALSEGNYFLKISVGVNGESDYKYGNNALEKDCEIKKGVLEARRYLGCSEKTISVNGLDINILSASKNEGQSV